MAQQKRALGLFDKVLAQQPRRYQDCGDSVRWKAVNEKGETRGQGFVACYAPILPNTRPWEVFCEPYPRRGLVKTILPNRLSEVDYREFIQLSKQAGLVPKGAKASRTKSGNCLVLPRGLDRHTAYVALCMYRFLDTKVRSMRSALRIYRQVGLPWLQVLYYVMACKQFGVGHGFINVGWNGSHTMEALNPGNAVALSRFCAMSLEERSQIGDRKSTYQVLHDVANEVNPRVKRKIRWGSRQDPGYLFADFEDIINPRYSILFTVPTLDRLDLAWLMTNGSNDSESA